MAAKKAVKRSRAAQAVVEQVTTATNAATRAVRRAVETATRGGKVGGAGAASAGAPAKKATKKRAIPVSSERAKRRAEKAVKQAVTKADRAARKAAEQVDRAVQQAARRAIAQDETRAPDARATGAAKVTKATRQVADGVGAVAKRVAAAAEGAKQRAARVVQQVTDKVKPGSRRAAGEASPHPVAGEPVPQFELADQDDAIVSSAALAGQAYVIYFYPRDNTSGCTREAKDFRARAADLAALGVRVIGVSPDSTKSHRGFREKHDLDFTLLADPGGTVAAAFGAYGKKKFLGRETMGIIRSTFLVGADGTIKRSWRGVRVDGHVAEVLAAVRDLGRA